MHVDADRIFRRFHGTTIRKTDIQFFQSKRYYAACLSICWFMVLRLEHVHDRRVCEQTITYFENGGWGPTQRKHTGESHDVPVLGLNQTKSMARRWFLWSGASRRFFYCEQCTHQTLLLHGFQYLRPKWAVQCLELLCLTRMVRVIVSILLSKVLPDKSAWTSDAAQSFFCIGASQTKNVTSVQPGHLTGIRFM